MQTGTCLMKWADGGVQGRESVGGAGRLGKATGRGGRDSDSGRVNKRLPGTAVSAEGMLSTCVDTGPQSPVLGACVELGEGILKTHWFWRFYGAQRRGDTLAT